MELSKAAQQFIEDCGSPQVVSVAKAMLIESRYVKIDGSIEWMLCEHGFSFRFDGFDVQYYSNHGFPSTVEHLNALDWRNESLSSWTMWVWENL